MNALKDLLQKKKTTQGSGQSWVKQSDKMQQQRQTFIKAQEEQEKKEYEKKLQRLKERTQLFKGEFQEADEVEKIYEQGVKKLKGIKEQEERNKQLQEEESEHEDVLGEVPMPKQEVIEKLRELTQPVTLFGETEWKRYKRYLRIKENQQELKDMNVKKQETKEKVIKKKLEDLEVDEEFLNKLYEQKIDNRKEKHACNNQVQRIQTDEKFGCILNWLNKTMKDWEDKLHDLYPQDDPIKIKLGRQPMGTFKQCLEEVQPLILLLKRKTLQKDILDPSYLIAYYCIQKEYVKANDKYLDIAIGNAPWPMGVTMIGIHERAGRSKIFTSQIAHVLNDENQRKYLQSLKRLITVSQKLYPSEPSKMVDFYGQKDTFF